MSALHELGVLELGAVLERGGATAVEATTAVLERLHGVGEALNVAITLTPELARRDAEASDRRRQRGAARGALDGIPLGVKDLYDVAGVPTTAGSSFYGEEPAAHDADVVARLRRAGMVCVAKMHTHEVALGVTSVNPHFGPARNPWDPACIPGGSSGGNAAALAARVLPAAVGSDTGGSIRIPAALCGVVGLKPTRGRWSVRGVVPLSWTMDHTGPMARTVADATALLEAGAGYDRGDPASREPAPSSGPRSWRRANAAGARPSDLAAVKWAAADPAATVKGLRIGLVADFVERSDPQTAELVAAAARLLASFGAIVEHAPALDWEGARLAARSILLSDAAAYHGERLATAPEGFGADVRRRLEAGRALSGADVAVAHRDRRAWRRSLAEAFGAFDVLLAPTTPTTGLPIEAVEGVAAAAHLTHFTAIFNLAGCPSLSVPCGFTAAGNPVGVQIIAAAWDDQTALAVGAAYQALTSWHEAVPPVAP